MKAPRKHFTQDNQSLFAASSGDVNPMHMDADYARRTQAGEPVVHGIHVLLWALDQAVSKFGLSRIGSLRYKFLRFVGVGDTVVLKHSISGNGTHKLSIDLEDGPAVTVSVFSEPRDIATASLTRQFDVVPIGSKPMTICPEQIKSQAGQIAPTSEADWLTETYSDLAVLIGSQAVIALALTSTLVGMVLPGLNSIYAEGTVNFDRPLSDANLRFSTINFDPRFQLAELAVEGGGLRGIVTAFVRSPPIEHPTLSAAQNAVQPDAFVDRRALVVGGSRGLGAATTMLLAAGGASVTATWRSGRSEAVSLRQTLDDEGVAIETMQLDVVDDVSALSSLDFTHLYYFATPKIFRQSREVYDHALFLEFCAVYLQGFQNVLNAIMRPKAKLHVICPSSVAVTDRPRGMTEYAMAKAASEALCLDLEKAVSGLVIQTPRLPRVLTDQTATVPPVPAEDPIEIMLPLLLET